MNDKNNRKSKISELPFKLWLSIFMIIGSVIILIAVSCARGKGLSDDKKTDSGRPDLITIDKMKTFGDLEEPSVTFHHDLHTNSLGKENRACTQCHISVDNKLSKKFMRTSDSNRPDVMDIYHNNCIGCHEDTPGKTGPIVCRDCHTKKETGVSSKQPMGFDNSLHFRHSDALRNKCELCHHEYDEKTEKLIYAKGRESSCRYCHKNKKEEKRISLADAAHNSCLDCHLSLAEKKKITGPVKCGGCHDLNKQKQIKKIEPVPVINRNQPEFVMMKTEDDDNGMALVPFNHKLHEQTQDNCRVCHHKAISTCSSCHSVDGKEEGGSVDLEDAMHDPDVSHSCTGCHSAEKKDETCTGCHSFIKGNDENFCEVCHIEPPETKQDEAMNNQMAKKLLELRPEVPPVFTNAEIPEIITIGKLSKRYQPSEFPHRKIINALVDKIKDNRLASAFHNEQGLICQGCHHNTPVTSTPPGCATCHEVVVSEKGSKKPRLRGAYHSQCMECHHKMKIGKTGCTDCHKKKE